MIGSFAVNILRLIKKIFIKQKDDFSPIDYWKSRVDKYGKRAVLHIGHKEDEVDAVTQRQRDEIYPYFKRLLKGNEKLVLDLACGYGRFTVDLAVMTGGKAIGLDLVPDLIKMAPRHDSVEYQIMEVGRISLPDNSVDVVWACLALGAMQGKVLDQTVNEVNRVLKNGGLLFLVDNTSRSPDASYYAYRSFRKYRKICSFVKLTHLHDYYDLGERISVMAGRKY